MELDPDSILDPPIMLIRIRNTSLNMSHLGIKKIKLYICLINCVYISVFSQLREEASDPECGAEHTTAETTHQVRPHPLSQKTKNKFNKEKMKTKCKLC